MHHGARHFMRHRRRNLNPKPSTTNCRDRRPGTRSSSNIVGNSRSFWAQTGFHREARTSTAAVERTDCSSMRSSCRDNEGIVDAMDVAADKSLVQPRGPLWHKSDRSKNRMPKGLYGVDQGSDWGCSKHDSWVQGYSFEVVVSATKNGLVFPCWPRPTWPAPRK